MKNLKVDDISVNFSISRGRSESGENRNGKEFRSKSDFKGFDR